MSTATRAHAALLLTLCQSACEGAPSPSSTEPVTLAVTANQPPLARIHVPTAATVGGTLLVDATESHDLDGFIVAYELELGALHLTSEGPSFEIVLDQAGETRVTLTVHDDDGLSARASAVVFVEPPPDGDVPVIVPARVRREGESTWLDESALLLGGATFELEVAASDATSAVDALTVVPTVGFLDDLATVDEGGFRIVRARFFAPDIDGFVTFEVHAVDAYGHETTASTSFSLASSTTDRDSDLLVDALDPDPDVPNGALVEVFALDGFPRDLLGRQMAEDVVGEVLAAEPVHVFTLPDGFLSLASEDGTSSGLALVDDMPTLAQHWALRISGLLTGPVGMPSFTATVSADDVGVLFIDGTPVASADEEFATNLLRTERLPASVGPLFSGSAPFAWALVVANEEGPFAASLTLTFEGPGGVTTDAAALLPGAALLPE